MTADRAGLCLCAVAVIDPASVSTADRAAVLITAVHALEGVCAVTVISEISRIGMAELIGNGLRLSYLV